MTTYEQVVALALNKKRAAAELARAAVIAGDVMSGRLPPLEWYHVEGATPVEALRLHDEAMLRAFMKRARASNGRA